MSDFAEVTVCGRMGEAKFFEIGEKKTLKAAFSVAVNRYRKQGDEYIQRTVWLPCVAWGRIAEQVKKNGNKGVTIMASGDFEIEEYKTSEGEEKKYQFIRLRNIKLFEVRAEGGQPAAVDNSGFQANTPFG
jgi:single-strand DNA-binding protein